MSRAGQTGFNRRIPLAWFERAAQLVLAGDSRTEVERDLDDFLQDRLAVGGDSPRNARDKTITILVRTWASPPDALAPLRDDGLRLLRELPSDDRVAVHWGMTMAAYPFFGSVAAVVGRLLRLQGDVAAPQVQRRMREQLGDRETVARCTRYVLRTFSDWGVLEDTCARGLYTAPPPRPIDDPALKSWLVEATLRASGSPVASLRTLAQGPSLFPFTLSGISAAEIQAHARLDWFRQGLSEDMLALRQTG